MKNQREKLLWRSLVVCYVSTCRDFLCIDKPNNLDNNSLNGNFFKNSLTWIKWLWKRKKKFRGKNRKVLFDILSTTHFKKYKSSLISYFSRQKAKIIQLRCKFDAMSAGIANINRSLPLILRCGSGYLLYLNCVKDKIGFFNHN